MNSSTVLAWSAAVAGATLATAAALLARRSVSRWAFVGGMTVLATESLFAAWCTSAASVLEAERWNEWRLIAMAALIAPWWLFSCTYARGDAQRFLERQRLPLIGTVMLPFLAWLGRDYLFDAIMPSSRGFVLRLDWTGFAVHLAALVCAILVLVNLERTFRAAIGTTRWRIKFALMAVALVFVTRIYTSSEVLLFRGIDLRLETANAGALIVAAPLIIWSFLRAGQLELDVYPSGSALKNSLTILLAGVYLLVVGVLAKAVTFLGGDTAFGLKAFLVLVAVVALAVGLQSDRLNSRLRRFVSHHFQRPLHDYRTVWRTFTERTATKVEEPELCRAIVALVADTFEALSVRIWLVTERRDRLTAVASTTPGTGAASAAVSDIEAPPVLDHFARQPEPVDLDRPTVSWADGLRAGHPSDFVNGGDRVCVPLFVRGELLGVLTLGDRVNGTPFSTEDFELLKCMADHAAASLLNVHLSQRLLQAKQLEAFQSMAAFFVHDLKNAASTLNLMLQNLPVHFDDPEFRADALRGIGKTVDHINRLIGRLSALRHELKVEPVEADLNEIVTQALAGLGSLPHSTVVKEMKPVPRIPLDPDQVHKVITNLILNAAEAVQRDGRVRVSTGQENGWVVLTVDDNGCGMSEEFVAKSLFRPFQTTKQNGLGIGMFQSKMIVEAHGGRIAVASQPGAGTKFQVFLRASSAK